LKWYTWLNNAKDLYESKRISESNVRELPGYTAFQCSAHYLQEKSSS